jgi:hypothetical protein
MLLSAFEHRISFDVPTLRRNLGGPMERSEPLAHPETKKEVQIKAGVRHTPQKEILARDLIFG